MSSNERRHAPRRPGREAGVGSVRVRPGIEARLVDVSAGGAALDTERRLLPGRFVHVQFRHDAGTASVRARVVRNEVAWLTACRVVYRCAVQFDRPVTWGLGQ